MPGRSPLDRTQLRVVIGVGAVALVALALAFSAGVGPFGGDGGSDFPSPSSPGAGDEGSSSGGGGADGGGGDAGESGGASATETPQPPFDFDVDSIEECGQTCRDVTATLENQQDRPATGVTVYSRIHAGRGTDGDVVWEGTHEVGTLAAGGSDTETRRVELSYFDALAVQREDGWITLVVTVDTDRRTVTFQERRDVA